MADIKFIKEPVRKESDWVQVGKAWPHKTKKDVLSGRFGMATKGTNGALIQRFDEIVVKANDPILIRPNTNRRDGKNDPTHAIMMLKTAVK